MIPPSFGSTPMFALKLRQYWLHTLNKPAKEPEKKTKVKNEKEKLFCYICGACNAYFETHTIQKYIQLAVM